MIDMEKKLTHDSWNLVQPVRRYTLAGIISHNANRSLNLSGLTLHTCCGTINSRA
jgi:hypothetical protein